jgi:precorrin-6B methylase 2
VIPHAKGGEPTVANLRLRCRAHNLHAAQEHFGRECIRAAVERRKERAGGAGFDARRFEPDLPGAP